MTSSKDQAIVTGLLDGDDSRFKEFYLEERQQFIDWCKSNSSLSTEEIHDLYQTSQMYLYENVLKKKVNLSSSLKTYLYGIAKNQLSSKYRKDVTLNKHELAVTEHIRFLADLSNDNDQQMVARIRAAIKAIQEPCKTILKLFYYESLSMKEIAERLNYKNDQVVKTQKNRCVEQLRKRYQKGDRDE